MPVLEADLSSLLTGSKICGILSPLLSYVSLCDLKPMFCHLASEQMQIELHFV
jgi:hypothetical protein